jgi:hypothetical protein
VSIFVKEKYYSLASSCESTLTVMFSHQEEDPDFMKNNVLHVHHVFHFLHVLEFFKPLKILELLVFMAFLVFFVFFINFEDH